MFTPTHRNEDHATTPVRRTNITDLCGALLPTPSDRLRVFRDSGRPEEVPAEHIEQPCLSTDVLVQKV